MNNLEKELDTFQATNINSISKDDKFDRDLFKDADQPKPCKDCDKNINVQSFVKDLEKNLDSFDNLDLNNGPMPANVNNEFKNQMKGKIIEKQVEELAVEPPKKIKLKKKDMNDTIFEILVEIKEPIIIIFLFILLNNEELNIIINSIPYFNTIPGPYPSLILRGGTMALIIYYLRKYYK